MLSKHKWSIVNISFLTICSVIATSQLIRAEDTIATATSTVQALKELLAIRQTSSNTSQSPLAK